jgi:ATP-binding cassette subfamily B protein
MTRMTSDIEAMNQLFQSGLVTSMVQIVTFVGTTVILFTMNVELALVVMAVVPPLAVATWLYRRRSNVAYARVREGVAAVNANFQESISGIRVAQAYNREGRNSASFRQVTGDYLDARLDSQKISSVYFPFVELMSVAANVLVLGVGARLVIDGSLSPGALIAFSLYINTVFAPIQQLSSLFDTYQQAKAAMNKLRELLGTRTSIPEAETPIVPGRLTGAVRFEDVHFQYASAVRPALQGVDLELRPGQSVALVGETGAGKSTIVKLLARFYDPTEGRILVDGLPLDRLEIEGFRRQLGYVPQEAFLFSGTIHDNIAYGVPDAARSEVEEAARAVGAHEFIDALPDGYDTVVTERGRSLSAGQRQLIALARALLVDPAILVLDEATANLDLATEARVNRAMGVVSAGRTTIVIAHRLPTAHQADRILVVDDGRVIEDGDPAELLTRPDGAYASLWATYHGEKQPA